MTNVEQYLNLDKNTCVALPKKVSACLQVDNFLSEYDTDEERELAMQNLLLLDTKPTEGSTKLVNSGDLYNVFKDQEDVFNTTIQNFENNLNVNIQRFEQQIQNQRNEIDQSLENLEQEIQQEKDNLNQGLQDVQSQVQQSIDQLEQEKSNFVLKSDLGLGISYQDFVVGPDEKLIQKNQTVTITDGYGNNVSFNVIVLNKQSKARYTITFYTGEGNPTIDSIIVIEGNSIDLSEIEAQYKDNTKIFDGWYLNSEYTGAKYSGNYVPTGDVTFYAKWKNASDDNLIMYSFSSQQTSNFDNPEAVITYLAKGEDNLVTNRLMYHYIPTSSPIEVTREQYGDGGVTKTVTIGSYIGEDEVYKIENAYLEQEFIKYN